MKRILEEQEYSKSEVILEGNNLSKEFKTPQGTRLLACQNINFTLSKGKTLGIVGESGCGKSTLLRILAQLIPPTSGELLFQGTSLFSDKRKRTGHDKRKIQMVFQDPTTAFSPRMTVKQVLNEALSNIGMPKKKRNEEIARLLELVELPADYQNRHCHEMSGGQRQRLGIARGLAVSPSILLCDEATCALDVTVQHHIISLLVKLQREKELSMVFVCHDIALVQSVSHQIIVLYLGNVVEVLSGKDMFLRAVHPYTKTLVDSVFLPEFSPKKKPHIPLGTPPSPTELSGGCVFQSLCPFVENDCKKGKPPLKNLGYGHQVACFHI